jgi:hypothetical protein
MKTTFIVIGVAILAIIVGVMGGFLIARNQFSFSNAAGNYAFFDKGQRSFGPGMMGGNWRGRTGPGMMDNWGWSDNDRPMMQSMLDAYAEALGMTSDDLQKELNSGKSLWDLASAKGITAEDYGQFMTNAGTKALNKLVADGEITQKQADAMIENMQENWQDANPETCPRFEPFGGRSRMWRWSTP